MELRYFCSQTSDGSMKSPDRNHATVLPTRRAFLERHNIRADDTTLLQVDYDIDDFCRYGTLADSDEGDGITRPATITADALVVTAPDHALFLPLADCIGAVIHDRTKNILMVSHLGRHSLEQFGGTKCIAYLGEQHAVDPNDLTVWLSPAAGGTNYPLRAFENRSMHDVAIEQLVAAGIPADNITPSPVDTTRDPDYFSHSEFLKGNRPSDGRFAIVAILA